MTESKMASPDKVSWLTVLRRYVSFMVLANLAWEFAQLPLYTIWWEGSPKEIIFAAVHCTGGDVVIATLSLLGALILVGHHGWPRERFGPVIVLTFLFGLAYTVFSEWLNTEIRGAWAYTDFMPRLPLVGSGLAPLAQWMILPWLGLRWAAGRPGSLERGGSAPSD
jgi:hypothetical protein